MRQPPDGWNEYTHMHFASRLTVATLLGFAAIAAAQNRNLNYDLLLSANAGNPAVAQALLDQGASANSRNRLGDTVLNIAARNGNQALVKLMLGRGADVNLARVTPLMAAAFGGHAEILKELLAAKADLSAVDRVGKTAMIYAAGQGCTACVEALLAAGVNAYQRYANEATALMPFR